jgi:hypothetical protein
VVNWGIRVISAIAVFIAVSATVGAQWPSYPTPDVPRDPKGVAILTGPPPRMPDGKVDFSGVWNLGRGGGRGRAGGGAAPAAGAGGAAPAAGAQAPRGGGAPAANAPAAAAPAAGGAQAAGGGGRGAGGGGGGGGRGGGRGAVCTPNPDGTFNSAFFEVAGNAACLPPMQQWAQDLKKKRMADNSKDNPDVWCLPIGLMQYHNHPQPSQIVQTKNLMLITYESNYGLRYVYLDGRPAPNNDPQPWWFGYSRGWWEGNDTLVVETTHFNSEERASWHDVNGTPWSDQLKMTERFRRPTFGQLQVDVTIEDPKVFAKPFTVRVYRNLLVDSEMIEFICNENEQSTDHIPKPGQPGLPGSSAPAPNPAQAPAAK